MERLPFSQACERNRGPILERLREVFDSPGDVLEVGSGTGQHAVYFAAHLPRLTWHASDRCENHAGIRAWMRKAALPNLRGPHELDVSMMEWPLSRVDGVFSANTAHIMHWPQVKHMFAGVGRVLRPGAAFCLYGPFTYGGEHTSDSNRRFDASLRATDPGMGIRDVHELIRLAGPQGMMLEQDHALPANNRLLVWRKSRHVRARR
jgi:SAM-dependent methyltransferase